MDRSSTPPPASTLICVHRPQPSPSAEALTLSEGSTPQQAGAHATLAPDAAHSSTLDSPTTTAKKKKKKKKGSYKDLMSSILQTSKTEEQARQDRLRQLQQHLGGGTFSKLDRI